MDHRNLSRQADDALNIPFKANRVLNIILIALILILLRSWHLAVIQYDEKLEESRRPQRRVVMEPAKRATISDRFDIPLAINRVQYNVAILYSQIKQIPSVINAADLDGKRVKKFKRKEYIAALSCLLGEELHMDPERIADLIHAKAIFYHQIPFVLKEDLSEEQYYRLKMLEKDWLGICVQRVPRRYYPKGKVAGEIIGYMGPLNQKEYETIIREIKTLETYIEASEAGDLLPLPANVETIDDVVQRLQDLHSLAYTMNDAIGKSGIEGRFERILRGFHGRKSYTSDARGNYLRELPGRTEPQAGKRLLLTVSAELQEYAEKLLIQNEQIRETKLCRLETVKKTIFADKTPWMKGGAIVAIDPNNGEVLTMASYPRYDPNDFIPSHHIDRNNERENNILNWLECEKYIAQIWNRKLPLSRETFNRNQGIYLEQLPLTWKNYLNFILPQNSDIKDAGIETFTLNDAMHIQTHFERLMQMIPFKDPYALLNILYWEGEQKGYTPELSLCQLQEIQNALNDRRAEVVEARSVLDRYLRGIKTVYDQVLLVDLVRMAASNEHFTEQLLTMKGDQPLDEYRELTGALVHIQSVVKKMAKELFHELEYKNWRKLNEKEYLKMERRKEFESNHYARPYIEILDQLENKMFQEFWQKQQWKLLSALLFDFVEDAELALYAEYLQGWHQEIIHGAHKKIEWASAFWMLFDALKELNNQTAIAFMQTMRSFDELNRPVLGKYPRLRKNKDKTQVEKHLAAAFYPKSGYGFGRSYAYQQAATQGSIFKILTAYEGLVQHYKRMEKEEVDLDKISFQEINPLEMVDKVYYKGKDLFVGYAPDGTPLPRYYKGGRLPRSISSSNGKLDVLRAIEVSSNPYFSILAGDILNSPQDLARTAEKFSFGTRTGVDLPGEIAGNIPNDLEQNRTGLYSFAIGQHTLVVTPLQTAMMLSTIANGGKLFKPKIVSSMSAQESGETNETLFMKKIPDHVRDEIFLPDIIKSILLEGMCRVASKTYQGSMNSFKRLYKKYPEAIRDYQEMFYCLPGKTSTAESVETIDLDRERGSNLYTHVWFGGIVYENEAQDNQKEHFLFYDALGQPELVVVVYLRYGGYGKEAAPVAAQIAKKWKEIKFRHQLFAMPVQLCN